MFFSEQFLAARPLLEAVRSDEPVVLLIDEVDRADEALEAVLLELLAEYQVSVPELGTFRARHDPFVVLTSNNTRDLSAALKRRCLHLSLDYPDAERELAIIKSKDTGLPDALARALIDVVRGLRDLDLRKAPSISETIDWARTLAVLARPSSPRTCSRRPRTWSSSTTGTCAAPWRYCPSSSTRTRWSPSGPTRHTATGTGTGPAAPSTSMGRASPGTDPGMSMSTLRPIGPHRPAARPGGPGRPVGAGGQGRARPAPRGLLRVARHQPETPGRRQEPG